MMKCKQLWIGLLAGTLVFAVISCCAYGSGFRQYLDELSVTSKYIVVATCVEIEGKGFFPKAKLRVEKVLKAPESDPTPKELTVKGESSTATRFNFFKGKRCFVFIDTEGMATRQGSSTTIDKNGKISAFKELICLRPNTDSVEQLTAQVESVLSGEYVKALRDDISDSTLAPAWRRKQAIALARTAPTEAVEPLETLIYELSAIELHDGSSYDICSTLLRLDPQRTVALWLKICRTREPNYSTFYSLTSLIGDRKVQIVSFQKQIPLLLKTYKRWEEVHPGETPAAYMLPIFANHNFRGEEVKAMLLAVLSQKKMVFIDRILTSAVKLNFPESVPLFWKQLRTLEKRGYEYANNIPHPFFDGVLVHNAGPGEIGDAQKALFGTFPELKGQLADEDPICMGSGVYFLTKPDMRENQSIYFVGRYHGNAKKAWNDWSIDLQAIKLIGVCN